MKSQTLCKFDLKIVAQVIQKYAQKKQLNRGNEFHAQLLRARYPLCMFMDNHLVNMQSKCGVIDYAHDLFEKMPERNIVSSTAMITAVSQNSRLSEAVNAFFLVRIAG